MKIKYSVVLFLFVLRLANAHDILNEKALAVVGDKLTLGNQISKSDFATVGSGNLSKDVLYELEIGKYTKPLQTSNGWNIFFLADTIHKPPEKKRDYRNALKDVKEIIDPRRTQSKFDKFYSESSSDAEAKTNGRLILALANRTENSLRNRLSELPRYTVKTPVSLKLQDAFQIEGKLGRDTLNADFIVFEGKTAAVPLIRSFNSWMEQYKNQQELPQWI